MLVCRSWYNVASEDSLWRRVTKLTYGSIPAGKLSWREVFAEQVTKRRMWRKIFVEGNNGASLLDGHTFVRKLQQYCKKTGQGYKKNAAAFVTLAVVGSKRVGKTSLLITYMNMDFPSGNVPKVFESWHLPGIIASPQVVADGLSFEFFDTTLDFDR